MNTELPSACHCFGCYDGDTIIAFMGVLHQPHAYSSIIKRVSRMVVLPDYQGIGIGYRFLCEVGKYYIKQGFRFTIVTSAKNFIYKLAHSDEWQMYRLNFQNKSSSKSAIDYNRKSVRSNCKTAAFRYRG